MRIEELRIENFRNIRSALLTPGENVNILYGENAQGKTNLLEAIWLLTGQRSFRQNKETDFIQFGEQSAKITASFYQGGRLQTAALTFSRSGAKAVKTAQLNEIPIQPSELTGKFCAVVFSPTELALVKEGPALRRAFLDSAISQVMPRYLSTMNSFQRVLTQRNALLYDLQRNPGMEELLEVWDRSFARAAYSIVHARSRYLRRIAPKAAEIYREISGGREAFSVGYQCSLGEWEELSREEGEQRILSALHSSREEELKNGFTVIGPHRDDLNLMIGGVSARSFGSQGQQRTAALTLKLAECAVLEEVLGEKPILLLDDVLSELDKSRRDFLLSGRLSGQLIITACDRSGLRALKDGVSMLIRGGEIRSRRLRRKE